MPQTGNIHAPHQLVVDQKQTIAGLQKAFNKHFHFLKIEFFSEPCEKGKGTSKNKMIASDSVLSRLQRIKRGGKIAFTNQTTVTEFEQNFFKKFGLCVQVFRKSGSVWLETSVTDGWTLKQQNDEGRSLAQHLKAEIESPDDHDIY